MATFIIEEYLDLETASKTLDYETGDPLTGAREEISEWALAKAINSFPLGSEVEEEDILKEMRKAMIDQTLSELVDNGTIEMSWSEEREEFLFKVNDATSS